MSDSEYENVEGRGSESDREENGDEVNGEAAEDEEIDLTEHANAEEGIPTVVRALPYIFKVVAYHSTRCLKLF